MEKGTCKHFNGIDLGGEGTKVCDAGVCYRKHVGGARTGWANRIPCIIEYEDDNTAPCDLYAEPTDEEVAEYDRVMDEHVDRFLATLPLIAEMKEEFKGRSGKKEVVCPTCSGKLRMSIAGCNGHVWGACETEGCHRWIL